MKKVLLLIGIMMLVFTLVACGSNNTVEVTLPNGETVNATVEPSEDVAEANSNEPVLKEEIPNYLFTRPNGETFNLHDYKGKIVVLNFWASW